MVHIKTIRIFVTEKYKNFITQLVHHNISNRDIVIRGGDCANNNDF